MTREIKFRVWDKINKTWATDFTIDLNGNLLCDNGTTLFIRDHFEIMQFTGITDYERKEIYEGDILQYVDCTGKLYMGFVFFSTYGTVSFCLKKANDQYSTEFLISTYCYKVIGNIHEHSLLLDNKS